MELKKPSKRSLANKKAKKGVERPAPVIFENLSESVREKYSLEVAESQNELHYYNLQFREAETFVRKLGQELEHWRNLLEDYQRAVNNCEKDVSKINEKYNVYQYIPQEGIEVRLEELQDLPF